MSSGKNSWTREVVCFVIIPIRIDPKASDEEAEEQVRQLIRNRQEGYLEVPVHHLNIKAIPLEDEEEHPLEDEEEENAFNIFRVVVDADSYPYNRPLPNNEDAFQLPDEVQESSEPVREQVKGKELWTDGS